MKKIESQWTHSINFNLLTGGAFIFAVVAYLLFRDGKIGETLFSLGMAVGFLSAVIYWTARRNLKFAYNEEKLQLQRFPYVAAQSWSWADVKAIDINDERLDESDKKTGEALYMFDTYGNRVLLAHRSGERTELRLVAAEFRRRISESA
jgi:hypothetical protein